MSAVRSAAAVKPSSGLATLVLDGFGTNVNMCFQCGRCAAGCPIAYAMDYAPAQLIHALRLGMEDVVFNSKTMWLCAACETCTTRCPQEVDIAKVMDAAKILAVRRGFKPAMSSVRAFHQSALANIKPPTPPITASTMCGRRSRATMATRGSGRTSRAWPNGLPAATPSRRSARFVTTGTRCLD